jgi:hypothetical protein
MAVLALALGLMAAPPSDAAEMHPHTRQGWLVGLGIGAGTAGSSDGSSRETGFGGTLRAGYAFNNRLSLELAGTSWVKEQDGTTLTFTAGGPMLSYYPGENGLVLQAGVGGGSGEVSAQSGNATVTATESGLGIFGGVGYEFRVTPRFAVGPQIHAGWVSLDEFNADWINFELGFHWYFIKK